MPDNITSKSDLDNEIQQEIISPLQNELETLKRELNKKETILKKSDESIKSKLNNYRASLKQNIDFCTKFGNRLLKIIAIIAVFFIGIIFIGFDSIIGWIISDESLPNNSKILYAFSTIVLSIILSVIAVFLYNYYIITKEKAIHNNEVYSIDSEKNSIEEFIDGLKSSAQGTQLFFRDKILTFGTISKVVRFKREWSLKCKNLNTIITFFNLYQLQDAIDDLGKNPIIDLIEESDNVIENHIITSVCNTALFDLKLMNLFVSYYNGNTRDVESYWEDVKENNKLLDKVAEILYFSKFFNIHTTKLRLSVFPNILAKTQMFDQSLIINNSLLYIRVDNFLLNYRDNIFRERIDLKNQLTDELIVNNLDFNYNFESNFIKIFSKELFQSIDIDLYKSLDENSKKAYVDALMAIILNHDINFRKEVCINASKNKEAIFVLMAYHNIREQKGKNNEQFSLSDLFDKEYTPDKMKEKFDTDHFNEITFKRFYSTLSDGTWIESTQMIILSMIDEVEKQLVKNEKNEMIIKIFAKYFTKININTLDRAVDAGLFTIYLILVPHTTGPFLRGVIDKLSVQIQKGYEITKKDDLYRKFNDEKIKDFEAKYGVSLLIDPHTPKYDFKDYSNSTRIGILHNTMEFLTFVDMFNKDAEKIFREEIKNSTSKWTNINFIILRISPSRQSFGLMNDKIENMDGVKFCTNLDIANEIATLASPYLTEQQKTAISTFEDDIYLENIFEYLTLFDLMSENKQKIYKKHYINFLKSTNLMNSIKECLKSYDIESFRQLSNYLSRHSNNLDMQSGLKKSLSSTIAKEYFKQQTSKLNEDILDDFVSEFLDSIKSLFDIWNHKMWNK
ncbi:MAG: hypothetical protein ACPK85_06360 [Methanosarcina sp.]